MSITHTVLVAVSSLPTTHLYDGEVADFSIVADFEVDADAEVDPGSRTDDVEICDSTLDDLGEHFAGALVGGHSHARFMSRVQVLSDHGGAVRRARFRRTCLVLSCARRREESGRGWSEATML